MRLDARQSDTAFTGYSYRSSLQQQINRMLFEIKHPIGRRTNLTIRLLRIVRLLNLVRYLRAMRLFISSMKDTMEILFVVFGGIALGAVLAGNVIYTLEPETFSSAFDGAWWGVVTMTTVGYGDVVPHTIAGRLIAIAPMVVGICMFAAVTGVVSVKVARVIHHGVKCHGCGKSIAPEFPYCPYCTAKQDEDAEEKRA
ncbi:MAG: ion channel [Mariprofundaceae bacterium]